CKRLRLILVRVGECNFSRRIVGRYYFTGPCIPRIAPRVITIGGTSVLCENKRAGSHQKDCGKQYSIHRLLLFCTEAARTITPSRRCAGRNFSCLEANAREGTRSHIADGRSNYTEENGGLESATPWARNSSLLADDEAG